MPVLRRLKVDISEVEILRLLGYSPGQQPHSKARRSIAQQVATAYNLVQPQAVYSLVRVREMDGHRVVLNGGYQLCVGAGAREWQGAEYLALAVCTIGPLLDAEVSRLLAINSLSDALYLDTAGSVAVESLAGSVYFHLCQQAQHIELNSSPRLSPGHGDWPLSDQEQFFRLLPTDRIGVSLNDTCLMLPLKSVSLATGVGKGLHNEHGEPCRYCGLEQCAYRRR